MNVKLIIVVCLLQGTFDSLYGSSVLIAYLEIMMGDPYYVGLAEAVQGMTCLVTYNTFKTLKYTIL